MFQPAVRHLRLLVTLILSTTLVAAAHAGVTPSFSSPTAGIVIPFDYHPPLVSYPVVELRINGHAPLPFLIDTGTNDFVLQPWAVEALGLTPKTVTSRADGSVQQQIPALKARLQDAANTHHLDVSVADTRVLDAPILNTAVPGTRLAGIVSFGFLGWSVFRLDFAAKTLTVFRPTDKPYDVPGVLPVPFDLNSQALPAIPLPSASGNSFFMILDTGTLGSQIPLVTANNLTGVQQIDYAFTIRGSALYITPQLRLDNFPLGPTQVPNVVAAALPSDVAPSLGLNVLSRYCVTVDAAHHQCFFKPAQGASVASVPSGIVLSKSQGGWTISSIDSNSPAAKAGLGKGDTILAVDGHEVDGAAKHSVQALLYGIAGTTAQVTVQRASGAVQNITFVRSVFTPSLHSPLTGLMLKVIQGGPLNVLDVSENCPAYSAGLRTDDKITSVNGKSVATLDFGQIADVLDASKLTLSVTRKGVLDQITMDVLETSLK